MNKKEKERGLTILELLVTITILVAAVTTVLALGNRAVSNAGLFTAYTQATFLAKEGMEIISDSEIRGGIEITTTKIDYNVNYRDFGNGFVFEGDCSEKLNIDSEGFYGHEVDEETIFARCVTLWEEGDTTKAEVSVVFDYRRDTHSVNLYRIFYE